METSTEHEMILSWGSACVVRCGGTSGYMETSTEHEMILFWGSACVVRCVGGASDFMETSTEHEIILSWGSVCLVRCGGTSGYMQTICLIMVGATDCSSAAHIQVYAA